MATLIDRITSLITTIKTETKAIRTAISGSATGGASGLATTATHLVGAINEVKGIADTATSDLAGFIDDTQSLADKTWSSNKISTEVTAAVAAALEGEDLSDLAAQVTANAQADQGQVTFAAAQSLTAPQITQFNTNIGIGEPDTDLVALWNAA